MSELLPTAPYRGTRDFLPADYSVREQVFHRLYEVIERFGYQRYDGPILESVEIYEAKSGRELADQQLYTLTDRRGRLREHWQINVDIFGTESAQAEFELVELVHAMFAALGASTDMWRLRINDRVLLESMLLDLVK